MSAAPNVERPPFGGQGRDVGPRCTSVAIRGDPVGTPAEIYQTSLVFEDGIGYDAERLRQFARGKVGVFLNGSKAMAVSITGSYAGNLNVSLTHGPSGNAIHTAAPVDNHGDGSSFSPTDLVAAALGACMLTVMGIAAEREGIALEGAHFALEKQMRSDPRRIDAVPVRLHLPVALDAEQRARLERVALACPVHHSLHPDVRKEVEFVYDA